MINDIRLTKWDAQNYDAIIGILWGSEPLSTDEILDRLNLTPDNLSSLLEDLEIQGRVSKEPERWSIRNPHKTTLQFDDSLIL